MSAFLDQIYGTTKGHVCVVTKGLESGQPDVPRWFSWPDDKNVMDAYIRVRDDEDNYVSVSVFSDTVRTSQDRDAVSRVVWADADTCEPNEFKIPPSIIVQTSPAHEDNEPCPPRDKSERAHCNGHFHCFWVLDEPHPAREVQEVSRLVAYAHRDAGCDLGWTCTKILRAPNTSNTKWDPPYGIGDAEFTGFTYSLSDFHDKYGEPEKLDDGSYDLGDVPETPTEQTMIALEGYIEDAGLTDLYLNRVRHDLGQSWSERMARLQMDLFRWGCSPQEVYHIAWNAACNKYHPKYAGELTQTGVPIPKRHKPEQTLWREVQILWGKYTAEVPDYDAGDDIELEQEVQSLELLTSDERKFLEDHPTFVDQFVDWCAYRSPDHARSYSHALAWGVLSCAYGNLAYLDSQYGKIPLNLWLIIAGDSTRTRKSTVVNLALKVVHGLETQTSSTIDIGSDATAEKLITELGGRDKQVSLLTIDEIQGFFRELSARQYRIGTKEKYTKLYDGNVPVVLRATQGSGNLNRAETVFNLWGIGIHDQIVTSLTREDFLSGFMYRTTWAISPPIPYTPNSSNYLNNVDEIGVEDTRYWDIVSELTLNATRTDPENPLPMRLSPKALLRANLFVDKLHRYAQASEDTALDDGIDRLRDSVVKCAALLSYHNGRDNVGEFEMLVAIRQGEAWFKAFQKMFRAVSGSEFSRRCDELEAYIASGPGRIRREDSIYKRFSYRTTEFGELSSSLIKQGRIRHVPKQNKWEAL